MKLDKIVYLVKNGDVALWDFTTECDWQSSCLAHANDDKQARELADLYDKNLIQPDNLFYPDSCGQLIVCLQTSD